LAAALLLKQQNHDFLQQGKTKEDGIYTKLCAYQQSAADTGGDDVLQG
jgi:hypothetical protein